MIEWIIQAAPLRKPLQLKNMNDQLLLLSVNEITHYFKKWTTGSGVLKKIYFLYKCNYTFTSAIYFHLQVQLFATALLKYLLSLSITAIAVIKLSN